MCVCVFESATTRLLCVNEKKKFIRKILDFFLNCTFCCFWWWEHFPLACLELFLLCFFTSFPLLPLFLKKKRKIQMPHNYYHTRSFCRLHQKLSKTAKIIISDNERSNFVTHRPSRDPNRELVLGTVLFRCVVELLFFFENFCLSFFQF